MRKLRFLAIAVISFVAVLFGAFLSPSTWLHKSLAVALCGVLSANPALCTNNAIISQSQEASATNPVKVETTQFSDLLAQRSSEFLDDSPQPVPKRSNVIPSTPTTKRDSPQPTSSQGLSLNGKWIYRAKSFGGECAVNNKLEQSNVTIQQNGNQFTSTGGISYVGRGTQYEAIGNGVISGSQIQSADKNKVISWAGLISQDGKTISGTATCVMGGGGTGKGSFEFTLTK